MRHLFTLLLILTILPISFALARDAYSGKILRIQSEGIGDPYNTLYLDRDVINSPCKSSNQNNRFTIVNNAQQSTALAALMADKSITIMTTGVCNAADIETLNYIMIYADK